MTGELFLFESIDADPDNADWTKQTLDLHLPGGQIVETKEQFLQAVEASPFTLEEVLELPAVRNLKRKPRWLLELLEG